VEIIKLNVVLNQIFRDKFLGVIPNANTNNVQCLKTDKKNFIICFSSYDKKQKYIRSCNKIMILYSKMSFVA